MSFAVATVTRACTAPTGAAATVVATRLTTTATTTTGWRVRLGVAD